MISKPWPVLLPGDVVLTRNTKPVGSGILLFTRDIVHGEPKSEVTHGGIISTGGVSTAGVTEARVLKRVTENLFYETYEFQNVCVARATNLDDFARNVLRDEALSLHGDKYTERVLFYHMVPGLVRLLSSRFGDRWRICTWVVGRCYMKLDMDFGVSYKRANPDDIYDFIVANLGTKYRWVIPPTWGNFHWPEGSIIPMVDKLPSSAFTGTE